MRAHEASTSIGFRQWRPSPLRRLLRRRALYWSAAAALAVVTAVSVTATTAESRRLRDEYGNTAVVLVTTGTVAAGDPLAGVTEPRALPVAAVPIDAVASIDPDASAARPVSSGAVLTTHDIGGGSGIDVTEAAVAVPIDPTTPAVAAGDSILLVVHSDPLAAVEGRVIRGRVQGLDEERVTVVIPLADLGQVSAAIARGGVGLALAGG